MVLVRGGDRFMAALDQLERELAKPGKLRVGFFEDKKYPDGTPLAQVAASNEFGVPSQGIPPRPFFRTMSAQWQQDFPTVAAMTIRANGYSIHKSLHVLGQLMVDQLKQAILQFNGVPLRPSTVQRKGSDKQLIDTRFMLDNVEYDVEE